MPKVTEAHLESRRQQVLDAAFACFARNGFHQTTMQDICREAQLSPGAVYRYFASKEEIIAATCLECQEQNLQHIEAEAASDSQSQRGHAEMYQRELDPFDPPYRFYVFCTGT